MLLKNNKQTLDQVANLVKYAFLKKNDLTQDKNFLGRYNDAFNFGEEKDGQLASYIMVNKFTSRIFDKEVKMGGVGYVSSYPENRGQGDINRLMKEAIRYLHEHNYVISNLAPFSESFYRRYGYENTIFQKEFHFKDNAINNFKPLKNGRVIRGRLTDSTINDAVISLYHNKFSRNSQRNTVLRENWWWDRINTYYPDRFTCVYFDENKIPQGYMFYEIDSPNMQVDEFYYQTPDAARALLSIIASHVSSNLNYHIKDAENSLLNEFFPNQDLLRINTFPYMMTRIIDMKQTLNCMKLVNERELVIKVYADDIIEENNGSWKLIFKNKQMSVEKTSQSADYSATLTNWTKVLLGHLTLRQAVKLGFVKENRHQPNDFVKGEVSFYDYF